jgi:hypothetical protein
MLTPEKWWPFEIDLIGIWNVLVFDHTLVGFPSMFKLFNQVLFEFLKQKYFDQIRTTMLLKKPCQFSDIFSQKSEKSPGF